LKATLEAREGAPRHMARILVTGASGLVGSRLTLRLRGAHEVHGTFHGHAPDFLGHPANLLHRLDIRDTSALAQLVRAVDPSVIVHCAAWTNVDACEGAAEEARAANLAPVEALAAEAGANGRRLIQMSTDYVFDGTAPPYEVDAKPNPLCVYSKTKADAEQAARRAPRSLIARSTVIYGADFGHLKRNFAVWLIGELRAGRPVNIVDDQWNTPTISEQVAEVIERAIDREVEGVIHATANECVPRVEFARRIARRFGLDGSLIAPVPTASLNQPARRPLRPCMAVGRTEAALGMKMWSIARSLDLLHRQLAEPDRSVLRP